MADASGVITSQVDLLWSVALALLLAEVYLIGRFFEGGVAMRRATLSWLFVFSSLVLQMLSMFFGYMTYGAMVTMARCSPSAAGTLESWCTDNSKTQANAFSDGELMALLQFGTFGLGLVLFVILFAMEPRAVALALKKD